VRHFNKAGCARSWGQSFSNGTPTGSIAPEKDGKQRTVRVLEERCSSADSFKHRALLLDAGIY